jgi:protein O-mannosyl-transferase
MSRLGEHDGRRRARTVGAAAALVVLIVISYLPALNGGYVWDDDRLLTANPNMQSFEGLVRTWTDPQSNNDFYPLSHSSFWLEYRLWGLEPFGYHLNNVLLHAVNAILVWRILRRLAVPGAWVAAAVFALHPVQVESVAWVSERKSVLGGLMCLAAVWLFVRAYLVGDDLPPRRRRWLYVLSLACYGLALLARPVTMAAAGVLPLLVWWKRGRLTRWDAARVAGYLALAAPMAALTIWLQYHHVGATGEGFDYSPPERVLIAGRVLVFYVGKLFWPVDLTFSYDKWPIDVAVWWQWLFPAAAAAGLAGLALLRRRVGRGPLAAALVFVVMLSPALGFINVYWHQYYFVADHMQYLACLGVIGMAVAGAAALFGRLGMRDRSAESVAGRVPRAACPPVSSEQLTGRQAARGTRVGTGSGGPSLYAVIVAAAVLVVLGGLTWQQCGIYKDAETIWLDTLRKNPQSWMARNNLGVYYNRQGLHDKAAEEFREALRLKPDHAGALNNLGSVLAHEGRHEEAIALYRRSISLKTDHTSAYSNLGVSLVALGRTEEAVSAFREALRVNPGDPGVHYNLGRELAMLGQPDKAAAEYEVALRLRPDYAEALNNLGGLVAAQGRTQEAVDYFRRALAINPDMAEARDNLNRVLALLAKGDPAAAPPTSAAENCFSQGVALAAKGQWEEAIGQYREALRLKPDFAEVRNNLGLALMKRGQPQEAADEFRTLLLSQPQNAKAHYNLGLALAALSRKDEAAAEYLEALRIRPEYAEPHNNLGNLLAAQGRTEEAIVHYREAIRINPALAPVHNNLGSIYLEVGRPEEAAAEFREALRLQPHFAEARANLQAAQAELDRRAKQGS